MVLNNSNKIIVLSLAIIFVAGSSGTVFAENDLTSEEIDALVLSIYGPNYQGAGAHINPDQHPISPAQSVGQSSPEVAAAINPGEGCNCVVFRMDDVQDFFIHDLQIMIFDEFTTRGEKLTIGPIANFFNQTVPDQTLVDAAIAGVTSGQFELFNHGWNHTDFTNPAETNQLTNMTAAQNKLTLLFPAPPNIFVPPFNLFNNETETVMNGLNMTILSSQVSSEPVPEDIFVADGNKNTAGSGLYHLPVSAFFEEPVPPSSPPIDHNATSILADIDASILERGYAVVLFHPFEFSKFTGEWPNKVYNGTLDTAQYQDLTDVIDGVIAKGYSIKTFNEVVAFNGTVSIGNVTLAEGTGGSTNFVFNVTRTGVGDISVQYQTSDGTATLADSDYSLASGTLNFVGAETLKTITVPIGTDSTIEPDEIFNVNLTDCVGCNIIVPQGTGTIINDDFPVITINNVAQAEGTSGSPTNFVFNVTRSNNVNAVTVQYQTVDGTAISPGDYSSITSSVNFTNGGSLSKTISVSVVADAEVELDEIFNVNLTGCTGCDNPGEGVGVGTITNDDLPTVAINDVTDTEGDSGTKNFIFTVTRSSTVGAMSVQYQTAPGTATSPSDYNSLPLTTLDFVNGGVSTKQVIVPVKGDILIESNETFNVNLSNCIGCTIADNQGVGTIIDNDSIGPHLQSVGTPGSGPGQFNGPSDIAIGPLDKILVADTANNRVQVFNSAGTHQQTIGGPGSSNGKFNNPSAIAVDSTNKIIVADAGNNRIQIFTSAGVYNSQFGTLGSGNGQFSLPLGIAVDSTNRIIVADTNNNRIQIFTSAGGFVKSFGTLGSGNGQFSLPSAIAVDSTNRIIVADSGNHRVQIFNSNGDFIQSFGGLGTTDGLFTNPSGVAIKSFDRILVTDKNNHRVQMFDSAGNHLQTFGSQGTTDGLFNFPTGLAADSNDRIIVADTNNNRIQVFNATLLSDLDSDGIPDFMDSDNIITTSTITTASHVVGNVTVQNGAILTISNGNSLTITSGNNITIVSGGGVLIKSGGSLQIIS
ncbi:MAG: 6-bladed beta-propeller [Nitrosopumilus sp.]|nr:6-bladed beta-propeller [Nitrosopumilus sp.]